MSSCLNCRTDPRIARIAIFAEFTRDLAAMRNRHALVAHGCCYFCDEALAPAMLFCGVDCRDDYDKEQAAKARAGRPGWPPRRFS